MKTLISIILLTVPLFFAACDNRVEDGIDKDPIILGKRNFHIEAEGGTIETKIIGSFFWYTCYNRQTSTDTIEVWYKNQTNDLFIEYTRNDTIVIENLRLWTEDKKLKAELGPNDLDMEKKFGFGLCKGNRHESLFITQDGKN